MRFGELEPLRVTEFCQLVYYRSAGIAQSHHLGTFVERLTYGVIYGLSENFVIQRAVHLDYLRVTS